MSRFLIFITPLFLTFNLQTSVLAGTYDGEGDLQARVPDTQRCDTWKQQAYVSADCKFEIDGMSITFSVNSFSPQRAVVYVDNQQPNRLRLSFDPSSLGNFNTKYASASFELTSAINDNPEADALCIQGYSIEAFFIWARSLHTADGDLDVRFSEISRESESRLPLSARYYNRGGVVLCTIRCKLGGNS